MCVCVCVRACVRACVRSCVCRYVWIDGLEGGCSIVYESMHVCACVHIPACLCKCTEIVNLNKKIHRDVIIRAS